MQKKAKLFGDSSPTQTQKFRETSQHPSPTFAGGGPSYLLQMTLTKPISYIIKRPATRPYSANGGPRFLYLTVFIPIHPSARPKTLKTFSAAAAVRAFKNAQDVFRSRRRPRVQKCSKRFSAAVAVRASKNAKTVFRSRRRPRVRYRPSRRGRGRGRGVQTNAAKPLEGGLGGAPAPPQVKISY